MSRAIDAINRNMVTPEGVRFSSVALSFSHIDDDTLRQAGAWLQRIEGCRAWWWGDFLCAYCDHELAKDKLKPNEYRTAADCERKYIHYTSRYSEAAAVEPETLGRWRCVAAFFRPPARIESLTWGHHDEAYKGSEQSASTAQHWLSQARQHGWSVSQLRAAIRAAKQKASAVEEPRPSLTVHDVLACARWAQARLRHLDEIDDTTAQQLLTEFAPIEQLITSLRARLSLPAEHSSTT